MSLDLNQKKLFYMLHCAASKRTTEQFFPTAIQQLYDVFQKARVNLALQHGTVIYL